MKQRGSTEIAESVDNLRPGRHPAPALQQQFVADMIVDVLDIANRSLPDPTGQMVSRRCVLSLLPRQIGP
jgi:hypothetical protein